MTLLELTQKSYQSSNLGARLFCPFFDLFCLGKKFLVFNLVSRNFKIKYHRSAIGIFWTVLAPVAMAVTYYFVFQHVMRIQLPNYLVFILSGVLPWAFFSQTVLEGMESIVGNLGLVTKIPIPLQVFSFSGAITNLITFFFGLPIVLVVAVIYRVDLGWHTLLVSVFAAELFLLAYSFGFMLSVAFVYFRDLRHLMGIFMQLWFFATPVIYDESMLPSGMGWLVDANPVGHILVGFHAVLAKGQLPSARSIVISAVWSIGVTMVVVWLGKTRTKGLVESL